MIFNLILSFFVSFMLGYLPVRFFIKENNSLVPFLSMGIGIGISSLLFFIWLVITGSASNYNYFEITFLVLMYGFYLFYKKSLPKTIDKTTPEDYSEKVTFWLLCVSLAIVAFISSISSVFYCLTHFYGDKELDAINFWTGKASFFYRTDNHHWSDILNSNNHLLNHPDYPLLLPNAITKTWVYLGSETQLAPIMLSILFIVITMGLLFIGLKYLSGKNQALLGVIILAGSPVFLETALDQIADVPFGFFILCSICLIILEKKTQDNRLLYLVGMTAGLCAWTKNEGILFFILVFFFRFPAMLPFEGFHKVKEDFLKFLIGSLSVLVIILYLKFNYAIENDIFIYQQSFESLFSRVFDFSRYIYIAKNFGLYIADKLLGYPLFILLAVYAVFSGFKFDKNSGSGIIIAGLILAGMLAGYFLVYVITPHNLPHYLNTSLERLLVQLLPSFLLVYFNLLKPLK